MKRIVIMFAAMMISVSMANAQNQKTNRLDAQVNHMTKAMQLDDGTAQKFETTYRQFQSEMQNLHKKYKLNSKKFANKSDQEIEWDIQERFDRSQKILDLRKDYYKKFRAFLSPRQIAQMYRMENNMAQRLRQKSRQRNDSININKH